MATDLSGPKRVDHRFWQHLTNFLGLNCSIWVKQHCCRWWRVHNPFTLYINLFSSLQQQHTQNILPKLKYSEIISRQGVISIRIKSYKIILDFLHTNKISSNKIDMALNRSSFPKTHSRNASLTNNQNDSHYSNDKTQSLNNPYFLHQTFILMIEKIIELTELLIKGDLNSSNSQSYHKPPLINLAQRKKTTRNCSPPTPTLAIRQIDRESNKFNDLRNEFERMREKVIEYKDNRSFNRITSESPIIKRSVEVGQFEISMIKMEEEYQKELKQINERIVTVEQDIGELLILYKQILYAH